MKFLVICLSGLGNAVLLRPVLLRLKSAIPNLTIDVLGRSPAAGEILLGQAAIDHFILWPRRTSLRWRLLKQFRGRYDAAIITAESFGWKSAVFARLTGARQAIGYDNGKWYSAFCHSLLPLDLQQHELLWHSQILRHFKVKDEGLSTALELDPQAGGHLQQHLGADAAFRVAFHTGSSKSLSAKRWPVERFVAVAEALHRSRGAKLLFLGGPDESTHIEDIKNKISVPAAMLIGKLSVMETACVLKKCDLLITNDSGLMHLAAAVGTPVVAIFGPTSVVKNLPLGTSKLIVSKKPPCSPCDLSRRCGENFACLRDISVEDVLNAAARLCKNVPGQSSS